MAATAPRMLNLREFEAHGRRQMRHTVASRIPHGESPQSSSFNRFRIRPRVLVDVSSVTTETALFGCSLASPFICREIPGVSGKLARARIQAAARRAGCGASVGKLEGDSEVDALPEPRFFQLPSSVPDAKAALVEAGTAKVLGFTAVVVCVDDPTTAWGWDEIQQLTAAASLPVVVKGVTSTADARDAVAAGCAAVCVCCADSDSCRSAAVLRLASVVDAVGDQVPVLFDGGVQRGTDAFKALALGATAVFIGRPCLWGEVCSGTDGVVNVLELLRGELVQAMQLSGCQNIKQIRRQFVQRTPSTAQLLRSLQAVSSGNHERSKSSATSIRSRL